MPASVDFGVRWSGARRQTGGGAAPGRTGSPKTGYPFCGAFNIIGTAMLAVLAGAGFRRGKRLFWCPLLGVKLFIAGFGASGFASDK